MRRYQTRCPPFYLLQQAQQTICPSEQDFLIEHYAVVQFEESLTEKEKRKDRRRKRMNRKQRAIEDKEEAKKIALSRRELSTSAFVKGRLGDFQDGDIDEETFYEDMKRIFEESLDERVELTNEENEMKTFHVRLAGFNTCAYSDGFRTLVMQMATSGGSQSSLTKKKRGKKRKISTQKGAPSWSIVMGVSHNTAKEKQEEQQKIHGRAQKLLDSLKNVVNKAEETKSKRAAYWVIGGDNYASSRKTFAMMFEVKQAGSGRKVDVMDNELRELGITRRMFDSKLTEIKQRVLELQSEVSDPVLIA
jgi:hypothetical protein